jgi:CheY-like chemotaxis protein
MKTALVIEDDADNLDMIAYVIESLHIRAIAKADLIPLSAIKTLMPDIILLDHWINQGLGGKLCSEIKSDPETSHIPVILLSAVMDLESIASRSKADHYLNKPFEVSELESVLKRFIPTQ